MVLLGLVALVFSWTITNRNMYESAQMFRERMPLPSLRHVNPLKSLASVRPQPFTLFSVEIWLVDEVRLQLEESINRADRIGAGTVLVMVANHLVSM